MSRKLKINRGFTLIELIVVIAVLGVLVLLATPKFVNHINEAKLAQIKNDVRAYENAIEVALIDDEDLTDNWDVVNGEDLMDYKHFEKLYDVKGLVDDSVQLEGDHYEIPSGFVNSKLKGNFVLAQGGKVYYYEGQVTGDVVSEEAVTETLTMNFGSDDEVSFPDTIERDGITFYKTGNFTQGDLISGEVIPEDAKEVSFTLSYLEERSRIIAKANRDHGGILTENHNEIDLEYSEDGYEGELSRTYIGSPTKDVVHDSIGWNLTDMKEYVYRNGEWVEESHGNKLFGYGFRYNDEDGYSTFRQGTIPMGDIVTSVERDYSYGETLFHDGRLPQNDPSKSFYSEYQGVPQEGQRAVTGYYDKASYRYTGLVFLGGYDNAKWLYEGTVTRPEQDTRVWEYTQEYEGVKEGEDNRKWSK